MAVNTTIREIGPDEARKLLERNNGNRVLRESWIDNLTNLILNDKWMVTHQGIAIADTGRLIDGQHRLHAIVRSGRSVKIMVTSGVPEETYRWVDGGNPRRTSDRIILIDNPHLNKIACMLVNNYLNHGVTGNKVPKDVDTVENAFLEMTDSFLYVSSAWSKNIPGITMAPVGAALVCFHHFHTLEAVTFTESLLTGQLLIEDDPAHTLREALISKRVREPNEQYWKTIGACRAALEKRKLRNLNAATTDFAGNTYRRLQFQRMRIAEKGISTKKSKQ